MIEPGLGAIVGSSIASAGALVVGVWGARWNRRTTLDAQRSADRAKALVRVLHIVELNGQGIQEKVFNLTEARRENPSGRDPVTGELDDPYAPHPRSARSVVSEELAEAAALLAAYGSPEIDRAHTAWLDSLDSIEEAYLRSESRYLEDQVSAVPADFAVEIMDEKKIRAELGQRVRQVLQHDRVRRFYR
jgi:hypothetical protein